MEKIRARVLIVSHHADLLEALSWILEDMEIIRASDQKEALEAVEGNKPLTVLTDVKLSGGDGLSCAAQSNPTPRTSHIPVILLSSFLRRWHIPEDLRYDGFFEMPFDVPTLYNFVRSKLG